MIHRMQIQVFNLLLSCPLCLSCFPFLADEVMCQDPSATPVAPADADSSAGRSLEVQIF